MINHINKKYFFLAVGRENIGKETDVDISVRCPICGDSKKNKRLKRLHLYEKNGLELIHCFNGDCPVSNKTVYSFLRDFYPTIFDQYKRETFGNTLQRLANGSSEDVFASFIEQPKEQSEQPIQKQSEVLTQDFSSFFTPIEQSQECLDYIQNRGLRYDSSKYGKWYYGHQDLKIGDILYKITGSVIIPLYYNSEMYGFYSRNINKKDFYTYMNDANLGYKVWNWFNVDKTKPVYIFEGIFDAISSGLDNVIALMGAKLPNDRLKELKHPVFVLDNDKTGLLNGLQYCKVADVYIQPDIYPEKDMNELMLKHKNLNIAKMIKDNLYSSIMAEVRIKAKL